MRQQWLYMNTKSTKARAWSSAHQYGLAVDFVAYRDHKWSWDAGEDWDFLADQAREEGLAVPYRWDRVHVEAPAFTRVLGALR